MLCENELRFTGYVGGDPEKKLLPSGTLLVTFSLGVTERWTDKATGEAQEAVEWIPCTIWGKQAETAFGLIRKGMPLTVKGRWKSREWEGQDGIARKAVSCNVNFYNILQKKADTDSSSPV